MTRTVMLLPGPYGNVCPLNHINLIVYVTSSISVLIPLIILNMSHEPASVFLHEEMGCSHFRKIAIYLPADTCVHK